MKKLINFSFALFIMLCIFTIPQIADAATEGNFTYTVSDGKARITDFPEDAKGEITIPNTLGGYPVATIGEAAFYRCSKLTSITISNSVTYIDEMAFLRCSSLNSITIPDSVTYIGGRAFENCDSLVSIIIPDSITSIENYVFYSCNSLTSITLHNNVTYIGNSTFCDCSLLADITIPDSVTYIGDDAFKDCISLTNIFIPEYVTYIGKHAFYNCTSLLNMTVESNNTFYYSLNGNLYDKKQKILICYAIGKTDNYFIIPDTVNTIEDGAFSNCNSLTNIYIPNGITSIGEFAFNNCTSLTNITIPNSITSIERYTFSGCRSLTSITIPNSVTYIGEHAFGYCTSLISINISDSVTSIDKFAFNNCTSLTNITIPDGITSIERYTFSDCSSLTNITIPDSVMSIDGYAFNNTNLKIIGYRGSELEWKKISIDYDGNSKLHANLITNCIHIYIVNENLNKIKKTIISSGSSIDYDAISTKKGYKYKLYSNKEMTQEISEDKIFSEDTTVYGKYIINKYTYTFLNEDESIFDKGTMDYGSIIELPDTVPTKENPYVFDYWEGYTDGMTLSEDVTFTPKFKFGMNRFNIEGSDSAAVGDKNINYTVSLATNKDVQYATIFVKYPDELILSKADAVDFTEITLESSKTVDGYTTAEYLCIYSYDGTDIPKETIVEAFKLTFDVSKESTPKDIEIELTADSILMGSTDYNFESADTFKLTIQPKLAESIIINGSDSVSESAEFTATVLPYYTANKEATWSVDDETIAEISQNGVLTGKKNGTVTITAASIANPTIKATKTVTVSVKAKIDSLVTDGYIRETFSPSTYEYTVYVDNDAETITLSPVYVYGILKADGSTILSGRSKTISLTGNETVITLERTNVSDCDNSTYTLTVIKDNPALTVAYEKSNNGYNFEVVLNKNRIKTFENTDILVALYDENGNLIKTKIAQIDNSKDSASIEVITAKEASSYKLMLLESCTNLKPLCIHTEKSIN